MKLWSRKCSKSDHVPLLLESDHFNRGPKPFRSLDVWFSHPSFRKLVEVEWKKMGSLPILEKLKIWKASLRKWNKDVFFGNINMIIE